MLTRTHMRMISNIRRFIFSRPFVGIKLHRLAHERAQAQFSRGLICSSISIQVHALTLFR